MDWLCCESACAEEGVSAGLAQGSLQAQERRALLLSMRWVKRAQKGEHCLGLRCMMLAVGRRGSGNEALTRADKAPPNGRCGLC